MKSRIRFLGLAVLPAVMCFCAANVHADDFVPGYLMASSTLKEPGYDHSVWLAQDNDCTTAWSEGAAGDGHGESLYFETDPYTVISGGVICPGYYASEDLFYKNGAPTIIYIHTGNQEAYLDVTEYANSYSAGFEGFNFHFDEPLVSDGSVTMTIVGVRKGWKYDDTCISEFRLRGYKATAETVPHFPDYPPHVSLVLSDDGQDQNGAYTGDPFLNPDGIGGDGREPGEEYGYSEDPEQLDGETVERLRQFAQTIYRLQCGTGGAGEVEVDASDLYSYSHAGVLNWYQAKVRDQRIFYKGRYNYAYTEDLKDIACELFDTKSPEADIQALADYFGASFEGEMVRMDASGNSWETDSYYLQWPEGAGFELGKTVLIGKVMEYNPYAQSYIHVRLYHALFDQDPINPNVFRFAGLYVN